MSETNPILETETEEDREQAYNEISISWGDMAITVRGDRTLPDIEDQLFRVLGRLKESLNGGKLHDPAMG